MPIKQTTPQGRIEAYIKQQLERQLAVIEYNLNYVGEMCVNAARASSGYTDRTHNLRSSTGFVVVRDGKVVRQSKFEPISGGTEGSNSGKAFAAELTRKYPKGYVLVVVAGMKYAAYVSAKGRDVLDSAEQLAERVLPMMVRQLGLNSNTKK